jgi:hypothetical protein
MKSRSREINIFNMSLLDILCGALGAFCFLMLVLFPFYSQDKGKSQAPEVPPGVDPKNLEEARARIKQLEDTLKKFQDYAAQLDAQNKQLEAKNGQMQQRIDELEKRLANASEKVSQYEFRNPFVAIMEMNVPKDDEIELYISDSRASEKKHTPEPDLSTRQGYFWNGDAAATLPGGGSGYFMIRDGPPGEYKVFLKVMKHNPAAPPISGLIVVDRADQTTWLGVGNVTKERLLLPIAVIQVDKDYKQKTDWVIPDEYRVKPETLRLPPTRELIGK